MYNWENIFQSVKEIWVPAGGILAVIVIITIIFIVLKKKGNE